MSAFADAPRAGSAEAKYAPALALSLPSDAPRAGSAEAKVGKTYSTLKIVMHPVQAAPRQRVSQMYS